MNIERIKIDLEVRIQLFVESRSRSTVQQQKSWKDKVAATECLVKKVYDTLYEVLQKNGIELSNKQHLDGVISLLEPSVNDIIIKNIED